MVGKVTSTGWELTYDMPVTNDARTSSKAHVLHADLAGGHFECSYADVNCPDPRRRRGDLSVDAAHARQVARSPRWPTLHEAP